MITRSRQTAVKTEMPALGQRLRPHVFQDGFEFLNSGVAFQRITSHADYADVFNRVAFCANKPINRGRIVAHVATLPHFIVQLLGTARTSLRRILTQVFNDAKVVNNSEFLGSSYRALRQKRHSLRRFAQISRHVVSVVLLASLGVTVCLLAGQNRRVVALSVSSLANLQTIFVGITERLIPNADFLFVFLAIVCVVGATRLSVFECHPAILTRAEIKTTTNCIIKFAADRKMITQRRSLSATWVDSVFETLYNLVSHRRSFIANEGVWSGSFTAQPVFGPLLF